MKRSVREFGRALSRGRAALHRFTGVRTQRGQAMVETVLLTVLLIGWGSAMMYFFPDAMNSLQIYMDSFYYVLSLPIP